MTRPEVVVVERVDGSGAVLSRSIQAACVRGDAAGRTTGEVLTVLREQFGRSSD